MKRLFFIVFMLPLAFSVQAQVMQQKAIWVNINVPQMKCWECKAKLEKYLLKETNDENDAGIFQVRVNLVNATVRIQYSPDKFTLDQLRTAIANAGYDADSTKANEDSYKMLPPACKRKDDGGGPQKGQPPCNIPPDQRK
jgi:copper chaperone CopZ